MLKVVRMAPPSDEYTSFRVENNIAIITLLGSEKSELFPWGTPKQEHRWNPLTVESLMKHLNYCAGNIDVHCVIVNSEGKFWSNGMDLAWVDQHSDKENASFTRRLNDLFTCILCFPVPTIAALNGHWCAAGGMFGLCFDYRVMNNEKGFFFVPAIDLGVVYSSFQIELMKAKLPPFMHREVICFNSTRWLASQLLEHRVIDRAVPGVSVVQESLKLANVLKQKGKGPSRRAMEPIKRKLYSQVLNALSTNEKGLMNFNGREVSHNYAPPPIANL